MYRQIYLQHGILGFVAGCSQSTYGLTQYYQTLYLPYLQWQLATGRHVKLREVCTLLPLFLSMCLFTVWCTALFACTCSQHFEIPQTKYTKVTLAPELKQANVQWPPALLWSGAFVSFSPSVNTNLSWAWLALLSRSLPWITWRSNNVQSWSFLLLIAHATN